MAREKRSDVSMDEQLSALLDNELDATACERAVNRVAREPALRDVWTRQALLKAVLSGEDRCMPDASFAAQVMADLEADAEVTLDRKVIPMARRRNSSRWWAAGSLAMAATIAGVAIILSVMPVQDAGQAGWTATAERPADLQYTTAAQSSEAAVQRELEEYLLEHQRLAGRHGFAAPRGYMRMATPGFTQVSYSGE